MPWVGQANSLSLWRLIRHGRAAMHSSKTWRTGSMPMTLRASSRVRRMFQKALAARRVEQEPVLRPTVSSTLSGSDKRD